jgi:hypothetical protein
MAIAVIILCVFLVVFQGLNPKLSSIKVDEENAGDVYVSPDGEKRITVYFNGGLLFLNDLTYVGVLEDSTSNIKKNIFLVAPNVKEVRWLNNKMIVVNGQEISIDDTYDIRDE